MTETCTVLGGSFALLMQGGLFAFTICILVWKKYFEHGDRTWFEFGLDSSKQIMGAGWMHVANMFCAILFAAKGTKGGPDECTWYATNIIVDTTLGVAVEWFLLWSLQYFLEKNNFRGPANILRSGTYRDERGEFVPIAYVSQLVVWLGIVTCMKVTMVALMQFVPLFSLIVQSGLVVFNETPRMKLFVVMIIVPAMMNTFQFVLTDQFIKRKGKAPAQIALVSKNAA